MKINGRNIYFDVDIQAYVEVREYKKFDTYEQREKEVLETKVVTKEHIKRELANQIFSSCNSVDLQAKQAMFFEKFKEKMKTLFLTDIESVRLMFEPYRPKMWLEDGYSCINLFRPSSLWQKAISERKKAKKENKLYKNGDINFLVKYPHIQALFFNLLQNDYIRLEYFINWLAAALVTLRKNGTAIVLKGSQGTGKGVLYEQIIQPIVGEKYTYTFSNHDLKSNFNKNLQNKLFIVGNEIKGDFREGNSIYETLKMWVTDKDLRIEIKGKDAFQVTNYFNLLIFSNNETPLQIQATDRRYTVFETSNRKLIEVATEDFGYESTVEFINGIKKELESFTIDLFKYDFKISKVRVPLPTPEKTRIYIASVKKSEIFADAVRNKDYDFFQNTMLEYVEAMDNAQFLKICKTSRVPIIYKQISGAEKIVDKDLVFKEVLTDFIVELQDGIVKNSSLMFMYLIATGENPESVQKIGTALTAFFGKAFQKKVNNKVIRYRKVGVEEELPF